MVRWLNRFKDGEMENFEGGEVNKWMDLCRDGLTGGQR